MPSTYIMYTLRLNAEKDAEIIAFLNQQVNKTATIKEALLAYKPHLKATSKNDVTTYTNPGVNGIGFHTK